MQAPALARGELGTNTLVKARFWPWLQVHLVITPLGFHKWIYQVIKWTSQVVNSHVHLKGTT